MRDALGRFVKKEKEKCIVDGCEKKNYAHGWCVMHYKRMKRYGDTETTVQEKHGMHDSREHQTWQRIKARCRNQNNHKYKNYGKRGIVVCERWLSSFINFYNDMGPRPPGHQIDRIDNNGPYSPENCRWTTNLHNARNKTTTKMSLEKAREIRKSTKMRKDLAKEYGVSPCTISAIIMNRLWKEDE